MTQRFLLSGPLRLDRLEERLWLNGAPVVLSARTFALLRVLMERPQVLCSRDDLVAEVWQGLAVGDANLATAVKELRKALGDDARDPQIIGTVHRRGYRFLLPVTAIDEDVAPPAPAISKRTLLLGAAAVVAGGAGVAAWLRSRPFASAVSEKSLVVLPFEDLSEAGDQGWFAEGLTEEVLNTLIRTPDLRVVSPPGLARFTASGADPRAQARRIGVSALLEGAVRRSGDRLRVSVTLIRAEDGAHIWSQTYDRSGDSILRVQEDIAFDIARALRTVMEPAQLRAIVEVGARSVPAYEAFVRGLSLERRESLEGDGRLLRAAGQQYEAARRMDPGFAAAHWRAAQIWFGNSTSINSTGYPEAPDEQRWAEALARIDQAVAVSPNDVDRLKYASGAAWMRLQLRQAHRLMKRYLAARPNDLDAWTAMADLSVFAGEDADFDQASARIHELSLREGAPRSRALAAPFQRQAYDVAYERAREQLAANADDIITVYQVHRAYIGAGRIEAGRELLRQISASAMPEESRLLAEQRQACAEGRVSDAAALRRRVDAAGDTGARWIAAQNMGDEAASQALLRPLDTPKRLPTLIQFMIYPSFDPSAFPNLSAALKREGVPLRRPVPIRRACRPGVP